MNNLEELESKFKVTQESLVEMGKEIEALKNPLPFAELRKAHDSGANIEVRWADRTIHNDPWCDVSYPMWADGFEYRIKPEPKPDVVTYICHDVNWGREYECLQSGGWVQIKLTRCGETGKLKAAEVI